MDYSDLKGLLCCPLCLGIFADPVTLQCGHNFCRVCIKKTLASQTSCGIYTCPQCGEESEECPQLRRNVHLSNVAQHVRSEETTQKSSPVYCIACSGSLVLAAKTCLHCRVSLCLHHLRLHSKSADHLLVDANRFLLHRRCPEHNRALDRYCWDHKACICEGCLSAIKHNGHQVLTIDHAFDLKKGRLKDTMETLVAKWEKTHAQIRRLEKAKAELTWKMSHVNAMLNTADSFAVLVEQESDDFYFCHVQEEKRWKDKMMAIIIVLFLVLSLVSLLVAVIFSGRKA